MLVMAERAQPARTRGCLDVDVALEQDGHMQNERERQGLAGDHWADAPDERETQAEAHLAIDDINVRKGGSNVELNVRLRNAGSAVANVTRAVVDIVDRQPAAAAYQPSASYDMLIDGPQNSIPVAHVLQANEVDSFVLRLGFTKFNTSCWFTATLSLRYNGDLEAESRPFSFDSCFD